MPRRLNQQESKKTTAIDERSFQYAEEHGKNHVCDYRVLEALFVEGRDIGQVEVLSKLAREVGLDEQEFEAAQRTR